MLSAEMLDLLRQWWKVRPSRHDAGTPMQVSTITHIDGASATSFDGWC
jgi:hypothetical protein